MKWCADVAIDDKHGDAGDRRSIEHSETKSRANATDEKRNRLSQALRKNLKRRKAQTEGSKEH